LFHNATFFGSCIIHILHTGCDNIKKKFRRQRVNYKKLLFFSVCVFVFYLISVFNISTGWHTQHMFMQRSTGGTKVAERLMFKMLHLVSSGFCAILDVSRGSKDLSLARTILVLE
jgi:hypothetical protein